jgi:hypothetical protein
VSVVEPSVALRVSVPLPEAVQELPPMGADPENPVVMVFPDRDRVQEVTLTATGTPLKESMQVCPDGAVAVVPLTTKLIVQVVPAENWRWDESAPRVIVTGSPTSETGVAGMAPRTGTVQFIGVNDPLLYVHIPTKGAPLPPPLLLPQPRSRTPATKRLRYMREFMADMFLQLNRRYIGGGVSAAVA